MLLVDHRRRLNQDPEIPFIADFKQLGHARPLDPMAMTGQLALGEDTMRQRPRTRRNRLNLRDENVTVSPHHSPPVRLMKVPWNSTEINCHQILMYILTVPVADHKRGP
jgi:hypothetical protein